MIRTSFKRNRQNVTGLLIEESKDFNIYGKSKTLIIGEEQRYSFQNIVEVNSKLIYVIMLKGRVQKRRSTSLTQKLHQEIRKYLIFYLNLGMNTITYSNWDSSNRNERIERTIQQSPKMMAAMKRLQSLGKNFAQLKMKVKMISQHFYSPNFMIINFFKWNNPYLRIYPDLIIFLENSNFYQY